MSEFERLLALAVSREKVRCICILACVVIVLASVWGVALYCLPLPLVAKSEPATYSYTDEAGTTTTTTTNGRQTITTVTDADARVISMCITGGLKRK